MTKKKPPNKLGGFCYILFKFKIKLYTPPLAGFHLNGFFRHIA